MKMMIGAQVLKRSAFDPPNVKFSSLRDIMKKIKIRGRGREAPGLTLGILSISAKLFIDILSKWKLVFQEFLNRLTSIKSLHNNKRWNGGEGRYFFWDECHLVKEGKG